MGQPVVFLSYFKTRPRERDWTSQELAEFYRVESTLIQHSLLVSTDRGMSDEGDPWFVFCRADDEEVIAHVARIGQQYIVVSSAFSGVAQGSDFKTLIQTLMEAHPLMLPARSGQAKKIFLHPTALLSALVATAFLISSEKGAPIEHVSSGEAQKSWSFASLLQDKVAILSAIAIAATFVEKQVELAFDLDSTKTLFDHGREAEAPVHLAFSHGLVGAEQNADLQNVVSSVHNLDIALLQPVRLGEGEFNLSEQAAVSVVTPVPAGSAEKFTDLTRALAPASFDAGKAASHDTSALTDTVAPAVLAVVAGVELSNTGHQALGDASSVTSSPLYDFNAFINPALGSSEAFHLVTLDLGSGSLHSGHSQPIMVSLLADSISQALLQVGYSSNDAQTLGAYRVSPIHDNAATAANSAGGELVPAGPISGATFVSVSLIPLTTETASAATSSSVHALAAADAPLLATVASTSDISASSITAPFMPTPDVAAAPLPAFDAQANQTLQNFLQNTPRMAIGTTPGSPDLILMDTNVADMQNHDFRVVEWQTADGSTLSIVGIIPHHLSTA